jgi:acyl dehydratase
MPIDYPAVLNLKEEGRRFSWNERDTMLYALAIGMGSDPLNADELPFVYEKDLRAVPTLSTVVAWGAGISPERLGVNRRQMLHGEEALEVHRSIGCAGEGIADSRVAAVYDKGDRGAVIEREIVLTDANSGERIATLTRTAFARADGGFGGPAQPTGTGAQGPPSRAPDWVLEFVTRRDQALLYRLCGDRNPLHADPETARAAGFATPILHGLCTYGICCRAVLQACCQYDPTRLKRFSVRFSAPVFPGDRIEVRLWNMDGEVAFEADAPERGTKVIRNGRAVVS